MRTARTVAAVTALAVELGLGVLGVIVHYGLTAEYGDVTDSAVEAWRYGFTAGIGAMALVVVGTPAVVVLLLSSRAWMRGAAVAVPILMVLGMLAVTAPALREKLDVQYDATPQCLSGEDMGPGPGTRAARESQDAFESIEHVGHFGGGGGTGVGGCDRSFVLLEDVDVLAHYRAALPRAGWTVVESDAHHLRAVRDGLAFEVVVCESGGVVWAGSGNDAAHGAHSCRQAGNPEARSPRPYGMGRVIDA